MDLTAHSKISVLSTPKQSTNPVLGDRIPAILKVTYYVHPENPNRMRAPDSSGGERHWMLEIHFVDRAHQFGGIHEELLTI